MEEDQYFVAHEFSKQERDDLREAIEKAFEETDLNAYYADSEVREKLTPILEKIKDRIFKTKFGIFDISNPKKPNVFLELGLAIAAEKPLYIICKKGTEIPADLAGFDRIEYPSYKKLTEQIRTLIICKIFSPLIEVTFPKLTKVNSWSSEHIQKWLKHPIGRGNGDDDFLYKFQGKVHDAPADSEVKIWIRTNKKWDQIGGKISEEDGSWEGNVFLHIEDTKKCTKKERADIGIDLFTQNSKAPLCSKIFTIQ